jgi:hypothetical protein
MNGSLLSRDAIFAPERQREKKRGNQSKQTYTTMRKQSLCVVAFEQRVDCEMTPSEGFSYGASARRRVMLSSPAGSIRRFSSLTPTCYLVLYQVPV